MSVFSIKVSHFHQYSFVNLVSLYFYLWKYNSAISLMRIENIKTSNWLKFVTHLFSDLSKNKALNINVSFIIIIALCLDFSEILDSIKEQVFWLFVAKSL